MAEMAAGCDASVSIVEGNSVVEEWRKNTRAGDTTTNSDDDDGEMQEADDVLNAIAGMMSSGKTSVISMSPEQRTSLANEAMSQISSPRSKGNNSFSSRECSNVCWALAKLRMAPPGSALPVGRVGDATSFHQFASMDEMSMDVLSTSLTVRMKLFEEAKNGKQGSSGGAGGGLWIPELSRLAGKVLDLIAVQIIHEYDLRSKEKSINDDGDGDDGSKSGDSKSKNNNPNNPGSKFNPQEMASVLWAFAKAKRGDDALFSNVAAELMRQTGLELDRGGRGPKPQGTFIFFSAVCVVRCCNYLW